MSSIPAIIILFCIGFLNYDTWPYPWPDEALFSSAADSLIRHGRFGTPVLEGFVPGMERATLWMPPLYMLLLSGVYAVSEETLFAARALSFVFACGSIFVLQYALGLLRLKRSLRVLILLILVFDSAFHRSAITGRMDSAALFFALLSFLFLLPVKDQLFSDRIRYLLSGVATGLAGLSHPIAVFTIPMAAILIGFNVRALLLFMLGAVVPFSLWGIYIVQHAEIFFEQFGAQLGRKPGLSLANSSWATSYLDLLRVYGSQYGGRLAMLAIFSAHIIFTSIGIRAIYRHYIRKGEASSVSEASVHDASLLLRLFLIYFVVFGITLLTGEAWYAIYPMPFLLLFGATGIQASPRSRMGIASVLVLILIFMFTGVYRIVHQRFKSNLPVHSRTFLRDAAQLVSDGDCRSVYLRIIPDPYFLLRRERPNMKIYEFVPDRLHFHAAYEQTRRDKMQSIDCFLYGGLEKSSKDFQRRLARVRGRYREQIIPPHGPLPGAVLRVYDHRKNRKKSWQIEHRL